MAETWGPHTGWGMRWGEGRPPPLSSLAGTRVREVSTLQDKPQKDLPPPTPPTGPMPGVGGRQHRVGHTGGAEGLGPKGLQGAAPAHQPRRRLFTGLGPEGDGGSAGFCGGSAATCGGHPGKGPGGGCVTLTG